MQRRAAAASAAVFLLLAVGAYAFIGAATQPAVETAVAAEGAVNESVTLNGKTYTVQSISATAGGQATLRWFNDSVRFTATIANGSNVSYQSDIPETNWNDSGLTYRVTIPNTSSPSTATFTELYDTSNVSTFTQDGETYVFVDEDGDGDREAVPIEEYFGERRTFNVSVGGDLTYQNNTTSITSMSTSEFVVEWRSPSNVTSRVGAGGNITLPTGTYLAYFQDTDPASDGPEVVVFTQDFSGYEQSLDEIAYWTERMRGVWGIVAIGLIAGVGLLAMAYLPNRY